MFRRHELDCPNAIFPAQKPKNLNPCRVILCVAASVLVLAAIIILNAVGALPDESFWAGIAAAPLVTALVSVNLIMIIVIACGPSGKLVIGGTEAKPNISTAAWLALLFSAGVGSGVPMWLFAEPPTHLPAISEIAFPGAAGADPAVTSLRLTFFHWGLHAWGLYIVLALATASIKRVQPGLRAAFADALPFGGALSADLAVTVKIVATLIGFAVSLGFALLLLDQATLALPLPIIGAAAVHMGGFEFSLAHLWPLLLAVAIAALAARRSSVLSCWLSRGSMLLLAGLLGLLIYAGNGLQAIGLMGQAAFDYLRTLGAQSFWLPADHGANLWQSDWTLFYWAWWFAWAPFMGTFIAHISHGRRIRELVLAGLLVPSLCAILAFGLGGGLALSHGLAALDDAATAGFVLINTMIGNDYQRALATVFFTAVILGFTLVSCAAAVTSLMLTTEQTSRWAALGWTLAIAIFAWALKSSGGIETIKSAIIAAAIPMIPVYLILVAGLFRRLQDATQDRRPAYAPTAYEIRTNLAAQKAD